MHAHGIRKGDRALVMLPRVPAWYAAMLGLIRLGAVPVPTPNLSTPRDLAYRLKAAGAVGVITDDAGADELEELSDAALQLRVRWSPSGTERPRWTSLCDLMAASANELVAEPTHRDDPLVLFFTSGTVSHAKMVAPGSPMRSVTSPPHASGMTFTRDPREVTFVEQLPKTISGKIRRSELRARMRRGEL